ncbi:hypothetical protein DXM27_05150 [Rhizobium rhizogenes]|uniref:Uncharacterized protein n=1 Tax=Rhizobium rhizogenes TaxID=359 RepID=A0AA88F6T8_RHIRH|nr:hypothetical protein [Rhizobium rhizogenes]KAA3504602.1 hypothetical protein DXM27_05150 [Rhizobium rhizogenes]
MATVGIAVSAVSNKASSGLNAVMPVPDANAAASAAVTSSASSQTASVTAPSDGKQYYWIITASGGNVWVTFGSNPTAVAGTTYLIVDGTTRDFAASAAQKCAVIDG